MSDVVLKKTIVNGNRVEFDYTYPEEWNAFIVDPQERLFFEYGFDLTDIPVSVLNASFVANFIVYAMFEDRKIYVDELDKTFYEAIPRILNGYRMLYPDRNINCEVECQKTVENTYEPSGYKICAFTGGVDATSVVATHANEKLILANIWGGDITLDNEVRYLAHRKYFEKFAHDHNYGFDSMKSNFRFMVNDLNVPHKFDHDWWAAVAHSISIVSALAPIAYYRKADKIYLGSTYTAEEFAKTPTADANFIEIVENIRISSCAGEQSDSHLGRIGKIHNITNVFKPKTRDEINILACWNHKKGSVVNCCKCEKCARTIMNIKACKADPNLFGFAVDEEGYKYIQNMICKSTDLPTGLWQEIQNTFLADKKYWKKDKNVNWILNLNINHPVKKPMHSWNKRAWWKFREILGLTKKKLFGKSK